MIYSDLYSPAFSPLCIYLFNLFGFGNYQPSEHSWSLSKLHWKTIWHLFPNDFFVYHVTKKCSIAIGRFNLAGNSTSLPRFRFISHSAVNGVQTVWFGRTVSARFLAFPTWKQRLAQCNSEYFDSLRNIYFIFLLFVLQILFGGNVFVCVWKQCQPGGCRKPWTKACKASKCRSDRKKCTKKGGSWEYIEQYSGPAL